MVEEEEVAAAKKKQRGAKEKADDGQAIGGAPCRLAGLLEYKTRPRGGCSGSLMTIHVKFTRLTARTC